MSSFSRSLTLEVEKVIWAKHWHCSMVCQLSVWIPLTATHMGHRNGMRNFSRPGEAYRKNLRKILVILTKRKKENPRNSAKVPTMSWKIVLLGPFLNKIKWSLVPVVDGISLMQASRVQRIVLCASAHIILHLNNLADKVETVPIQETCRKIPATTLYCQTKQLPANVPATKSTWKELPQHKMQWPDLIPPKGTQKIIQTQMIPPAMSQACKRPS